MGLKMGRPNYQGYMQDANYNADNPDTSYYAIGIQLLFKVTTSSVKIDLIDRDGSSMIEAAGEENAREVHYM